MLHAFRDEIFELAKNNKKIIVICTDQEIGLEKVAHELPNQYLMEGISEANITGVAAGLAMRGFIPYIVNHASFLTRRSYEQIALDVCLQNLPVRFIGMGGGLATAHLGPTHTTIEDVSIMRSLPGMTVVIPSDADEVKRLVKESVNWPTPLYMRLAKYGKPHISDSYDKAPIGSAAIIKKATQDSYDVLLVATGYMLSVGLEVHEALTKLNISTSLVNTHTIKPFDKSMLAREGKKAKLVVTLEEHSLIGGLGSVCMEALVDNLPPAQLPKIMRIGLEDKFVHNYGSQADLFLKFGLDTQSVLKKIQNMMAELT
jgi:transketolase